jgi:hypothetical protein
MNRPILTLKPRSVNPLKEPSRAAAKVQVRKSRKVPPPMSARELHVRLCHGDLTEVAPALGRYLPLALGVQCELRHRLGRVLIERCPTLNRVERLKRIRTVLQRHTALPAYLEAVAATGSLRHDLDGKPIEPVTDEHREYARVRLQEGKKL